jgi:hypothetical protein
MYAPPHYIEEQFGGFTESANKRRLFVFFFAEQQNATDTATFRANPRVILAFHLALEP